MVNKNTGMRGRLIILDPSLKDDRGHHYALTSVISSGAKELGVDVLWYVSKKFQMSCDSQAVSVRPLFTESMYDGFIKEQPTGSVNRKKTLKYIKKGYRLFRKGILRHKRKNQTGEGSSPRPSNSPVGFVDELLKGFAADFVGHDDRVLVHTADGKLYRAVLELSLRPEFISSFPSFHLSTPYDSKVMPHNKAGLSARQIAFYFQVLGVLKKKVFLYAENEFLAKHLSQEWGVQVGELEIPAPDVHLGCRKLSESEPLNVVYMGAAREEKGFHLIPEIIQAVLSRSESRHKITFTIQASPQIVGYAPIIEEALEKLHGISSDSLNLIVRTQSMSDYFAMLKDADVVLTCYDHDKYSVRGSGIAVEAVSFGKVLIATSDTFPSKLAAKAAVCADTPQQVADRIFDIANNKKEYMSRALSRMEAYQVKNTATNYVLKVFSSVGRDNFPSVNCESLKTLDTKSLIKSYLGGQNSESEGVVFPQLIINNPEASDI